MTEASAAEAADVEDAPIAKAEEDAAELEGATVRLVFFLQSA